MTNVIENIPENILEIQVTLLFSWHGDRLRKLGYDEKSIKLDLELGKCQIESGRKIKTLVLDGKRYGFANFFKEDITNRFKNNLRKILNSYYG